MKRILCVASVAALFCGFVPTQAWAHGDKIICSIDIRYQGKTVRVTDAKSKKSFYGDVSVKKVNANNLKPIKTVACQKLCADREGCIEDCMANATHRNFNCVGAPCKCAL